jgi:DNA replication and repair protein RecF
MAEVDVAEDIVGEKPLLLLDDVMSELDSHRRDAVIKFVEKDIQTIITTTNLDYFSHELLDRAEVVTFNGCT